VEEFDTDLKLPEWQLEPDDEFYYGEEDGYYFYIDEQGNLVDPSGDQGRYGEGFDVEGEGENVVRDPLDPRGMDQQPVPRSSPAPRPTPAPRRSEAPQAASDDFLEQATGRDLPRDDRRQNNRPAPGVLNEQRF
jgi:penicillin-binding protein 1A